MSEILKAYKLEHTVPPKSPQQLVEFSKSRDDLKNLTMENARKIMGIKRRNSSFNTSSLSTKANPRWKVGTQVLLSKDRMGIIRYVGPVPEQGQGSNVIWYGVELTDGTVGYNDGMLKGKRYFKTEGKRGMFVPPDKIRRVINDKDKQRRDSYAQLANDIKQLKQHYNMDVIDGNGALVINYNENENENSNESKVKNGHSIYIAPNNRHDMSDGGNISPLSTDDNLRPWEKEEFAVGGPSHKLNMKAKLQAKEPKSKGNKINKNNKINKGKKRDNAKSPYIDTTTQLTEDNIHNTHGTSRFQRPRAYSIESDRKEYGIDLETIDSYDTLLEYVLRQSHDNLSILLDVYASPDLNPILKDAFNQMKEMDKAKQAMLWPQLIKRWRRFLRTKK